MSVARGSDALHRCQWPPGRVLLHGGGLSHRQWRIQQQGITDLHLLAPDLPEHGLSRAGDPFTLESAADALLATLDRHLPGQRLAVVGNSLGSAVALHLLRRAPQRWTRVLVTGTSAGLSRPLAALMALGVRLTHALPQERLIHMALKQFAIPRAYQSDMAADLRATLHAATQQRLVAALGELQLPRHVEVPVLALVGARETAAAKQGARQIARVLPQAQMAVVPGVGHVWNLEAPALFEQVLRAWLADRPLPWSLQGEAPSNTHGTFRD